MEDFFLIIAIFHFVWTNETLYFNIVALEATDGCVREVDT